MLIRKDSSKEFSPAKSQYSTSDGKSFMPCCSTSPTLVPGVYDAYINDYGAAVFSRNEFNDERLVDFPGTNTHKVVEEVTKFWALEEHFKAHGVNHKRGIIMWGPPGSGKSCAIRLVSLDVIRRGGIVLRRFNRQFVNCYNQFREIQPDTPLLVLMEDLDSIIDTMDESLVLNVLDGLYKLHKTVFLATTNHPERLGDRIIKRPSRFDRRFYIGHPNREARHAYLKFIWPEIGEDDLRTWANDTKGFSFAHLKELFVAVHMFETPYQDALKTLSNMRKDVLEDGKDAEVDENVKCAVVKCAQTANEEKLF